MENFSTIQASNITVVAGAIVILITKLKDPSSLTAEDITTIIMALSVAIAGIKSFVSRYKKGDLKMSGVRK